MVFGAEVVKSVWMNHIPASDMYINTDFLLRLCLHVAICVCDPCLLCILLVKWVKIYRQMKNLSKNQHEVSQ